MLGTGLEQDRRGLCSLGTDTRLDTVITLGSAGKERCRAWGAPQRDCICGAGVGVCGLVAQPNLQKAV